MDERRPRGPVDFEVVAFVVGDAHERDLLAAVAGGVVDAVGDVSEVACEVVDDWIRRCSSIRFNRFNRFGGTQFRGQRVKVPGSWNKVPGS